MHPPNSKFCKDPTLHYGKENIVKAAQETTLDAAIFSLACSNLLPKKAEIHTQWLQLNWV
jgi:hypothetical protein